MRSVLRRQVGTNLSHVHFLSDNPIDDVVAIATQKKGPRMNVEIFESNSFDSPEGWQQESIERKTQ